MEKLKSLFKHYFFTGLLVMVPLVMTAWVVRALISGIDDFFGTTEWMPYHVPGVGLVLSLAVILVSGFLARNFVGNFVIEWLSETLNRIPLIGAIYGSVRQVMTTILGGSEKKFGRVVLVEYPRREAWTIGFVTSENVRSDIGSNFSDRLIAVYVPTTPNPTSGFLIFVPEKDLKPLQLKVEDALKYVVSLGIVEGKTKPHGH